MRAIGALLKPASAALAAVSLLGLGSVGPAWAQTGYPAAPPGYVAPGTNTELITNGPLSSGVEQSGTWSPRQNVIESRRYTRLRESNPAFREARMRKECSPVTDPRLHEQCVASFNRYSPGA